MEQPVEPSNDAFLPAGQSVHAVAPGWSEKVPTLQRVQESARLEEKVPTPHVVQLVLRSREKVPAEQSAQVVAALWIPVNEPLPHVRHPSSSAVGVNLPFSQF